MLDAVRDKITARTAAGRYKPTYTKIANIARTNGVPEVKQEFEEFAKFWPKMEKYGRALDRFNAWQTSKKAGKGIAKMAGYGLGGALVLNQAEKVIADKASENMNNY
jgi:hypothetical protein